MPELDMLQILIGEFHDVLSNIPPITLRDAQFSKVANKIKVAIGMRRTGKTYFVYQYILHLLQRNISLTQILFLNFEDDRLLPLDFKKLAKLLEGFYTLYPQNHNRKCYLFLDEIQNVIEWASVIRRFHDTKNVEIFLTGSSAKLLSKEIATSLRGRSLSTEIWPYSFSEWMRGKNIVIDTSLYSKKVLDNLSNAFNHYLREGGFPEVCSYTQEIRQRTLQDYVDVVIYRDIIERHQISNATLIKYMIITMIRNVGKPFSINKFYNDTKSQGHKTSKDALYEYANYIEDAYLAFSVPLHSKSIRKVQTNPKKIYAIDAGLATAISLDFGSDLGRLFENIVYLDLRRQGYIVEYYLTEERYEVDFLAQDRQGDKKLFQVVWSIEDKATFARETRALEKAKSELGLPGKIITLDSYLRGITIAGDLFSLSF